MALLFETRQFEILAVLKPLSCSSCVWPEAMESPSSAVRRRAWINSCRQRLTPEEADSERQLCSLLSASTVDDDVFSDSEGEHTFAAHEKSKYFQPEGTLKKKLQLCGLPGTEWVPPPVVFFFLFL